MDDITPDMNWKQFWRFIDLFQRYGVKPLLGVVPDNKDKKLAIEPKRNDFWQVMRNLQSQEAVEFAQHGYQHLYETDKTGILGRKYGFFSQSEFSGLPYAQQYRKIKAGRKILQDEGIYTDIWMAPAHSFDMVTLRVLYDLGFKAVTDGIALFPYGMERLLFVPQQAWKPEYFPMGIVTICLHTNSASEGLFQSVKKHLESKAGIISFSDAVRQGPRLLGGIFNNGLRSYFVSRRVLGLMREKVRRSIIRNASSRF